MAKKLVVVESPAKANTIKKFLGSGYLVEACAGHIRDLPAKKLGVDVKHDFEPTYQVVKGKEKIVKTLKEHAKKASLVLLAPDPDREGEAIAWHLSYLLGGKEKIKRIEFNEITKKAVEDAVKHPREIDLNRVNAQQARRILDRLVGYKLSPLLWKKVRKGLSAGRVQSVAVRLICERQKEIDAFKPVEYWTITALLTKTDEKTAFPAKLLMHGDKKIEISNEKEAADILKELESAQFAVSRAEKKEQKRNPSPPFITSSLQQEASRRLGFSAKKTMMIAQMLYEGVTVPGEGAVGLISYMRTDSFRIAKEAQDDAKTFIDREFGAKYIPSEPRVYKKKKQAQDAHEAIRPTSVFRTPEKIKDALSPDQLKLYTLIWNRFAASQMASAVLDMTSIDIAAKDYTFRATGSTIKFDGFMRLYIEEKDEGEEPEAAMPPLQAGEDLKPVSITPEQHFTEPSPRYTEASLVKELEARGIGRPSTYAPIISTIVDRGYVERDGKAFRPTELGMTINDLLVIHFPTIMDFEFTAHMEDVLDDIVAGKLDWIDALKEFYDPFKKNLDEAEVKMEKIKKEIKTDEKCPKCGKPLLIRSGRFGDFLACSGYPECKHTKNLPSPESEKYANEICEKCGKPMVVKGSKFGTFLACSGYPKCKSTKSILVKTGVKCPEDGGDIVMRRSKKGRIFYSCSNYPKCKFSLWNKPLDEKCPKCGSLLTEKRLKGSTLKKCSGEKCDYVSEM